jgi:hypothetical protein
MVAQTNILKGAIQKCSFIKDNLTPPCMITFNALQMLK